MRLSRFWSGYVRFQERVDLRESAIRLGGWAALARGGASGLRECGVPEKMARQWFDKGLSTFGTAITLDDPRYPANLSEIPHAPPALFVEGDVEALSAASVGVVGTRSCTSYGSSMARLLSGGLAARGVSVVSGLARGIDAHAHDSALRAGRTVAVLGHGLAFTAPSSNRALRHRIVSNGGAIVSAFPDDTEPRPYTFPKRNRWIAGLSKMVVVVEAPIRSGALITARHAMEIGRDVLAFPHRIGVSSSAGCLRLIADGAGIIADVDEFLSTLGTVTMPASDQWLGELFRGSTVDEVSRRFGRSVSELLVELSRLEVDGAVVRLPGQRYAPVGSTQ